MRKVHFASLMDLCHLKKIGVEAKISKVEAELYSEVTFVKDDSGSYSIFTEQGSPACQMTAAKVMGIISRFPGCAGQAADAVSANTHVKMEDAPKLLKFPNRNVQTLVFMYHDTDGQSHGPVNGRYSRSS